MRKSELIKQLNAIEGDFEVCICDFRKNIHNIDGGGEPNASDANQNTANQ